MTAPEPPRTPPRTRASRRPRPPRAGTTRPDPAPDRPPADPAAAGARRVTLAAVTGAHGVGGEVRLKLFTDDLARYPVLAAGAATLTLTALRPGPQGAVARFAEVRDRTAAEALRGTALTVAREALPPLADGEYYHADVIGLPCVAADGAMLGRIAAIEDFGAGDVLEIVRADGTRAMIAFRAPDAVLDAERVVVDPAFLV